eukprot:5496397-Amphidinium_carterae.1
MRLVHGHNTLKQRKDQMIINCDRLKSRESSRSLRVGYGHNAMTKPGTEITTEHQMFLWIVASSSGLSNAW